MWDEEQAELSSSSRAQQAALPELSMEGQNPRRGGHASACCVLPCCSELLKVQPQHMWHRDRSEGAVPCGAVSSSPMALCWWGDDKSSCRLLGSSQEGPSPVAGISVPHAWQSRSCHHQHVGGCCSCSCSASLGGDVRFELSMSGAGIRTAEHGDSGSVPLGAQGRGVLLSPGAATVIFRAEIR